MESTLEGLRAAAAAHGADVDDPRLELAIEVAVLAAALIRADEVVLDEERVALRRALVDHLGLSDAVGHAVADHVLALEGDAVPSERAALDHVARREPDEKLVLVDVLLGICAADGSLHAREKTYLQTVAARLGVPSGSFRELMRKWDPRGSPGTRHARLGDRPVTVGSAPDNVIRLTGLTVSRHHAVLRPDGDSWVIEDQRSTNGTWVNGERVTRQRLSRGDLVRIEQHCLRIDPGRGVLWVWDSGDFLTLTADGLSVDVADRNRRGSIKRILHDASFQMHSGELVALMGPSGCGKTTLLNALLGTVEVAAGQVLLNRERCRLVAEHASRVGVVPQDDIVYSRLTVEESLHYSSRLRSVPGVPDGQLADAVDRVIGQLGLGRIRHATIGDPVRRGISGGERKRVNLGQELLNPGTRILALDEPTTGLDPHTGAEIMRLLRALADEGRVVLAVTHQVDETLFALVDKVLLLGAGGHVVYFGPADQALGFFGVETAAELFGQLNEPDAAARLAARFRESKIHQRHVVLPRLMQQWPEPEAAPEREAREAAEASVAEPWDTEEIPSSVVAAARPAAAVAGGQTMLATRAPALVHDRTAPSATRRLGDTLRGGLRQLVTLVERYARVKWRDRAALIVALGQIPLIVAGCWVVLAGTLTYHDGRLDQTFTTVPGSLPFVLVISAFWFGCVNAVRELVADQAIFRRERHAGVHTTGYLGSKVAVLFSLTTLQCVILLAAAYGLFGLAARHVDPLQAAAILVLVGLFGTALGLLVSAAFRSVEAAVSILPALVIPQLLFGGLLVPLDRMWAPLRWVSAVMATRWGMSGLLQAGDPAVGPGGVASVSECTQYSPPTGESGACVYGFLEELGFAHREAIEGQLIATRVVVDGTYGEACLALTVLTVLAVLATGVVLRSKRQ